MSLACAFLSTVWRGLGWGRKLRNQQLSRETQCNVSLCDPVRAEGNLKGEVEA